MNKTHYCPDCKLDKKLSQFYIRKSDKTPFSYCIPCFKFRVNKCRVHYQKQYNQSSRGRYNFYKSHAKSRGLCFELSYEQFESFNGKHCIYCGDILKRVGIDRHDNKIGYVLSNCKPCCTVCNRMKRDYDVDFFYEKIEKIYMNKIAEKIKRNDILDKLIRVI